MSKDSIALWKDTNLISYFENNEFVSTNNAAVLLENQRLYNETLCDVGSDIENHRFLQNFRQTSLAMAVRVLHLMKAPELVSFNPVEDSTQSTARHPLKTMLCDVREAQSRHPEIDLSSELCVLVSYSVAMEIDQHIISDLRRNAGTVAYVDPSHPDTDFYKFYEGILEVMKEKCGHYPNWMVASPEVCSLMNEYSPDWRPATDNVAPSISLRYVSYIGWYPEGCKGFPVELKLFENPLAPEGELLLGYKGTDESTYEFRPMLLLEAVPEKGVKIRKAQLHTHFDIHWPDNGGDFYARINVKAPD